MADAAEVQVSHFLDEHGLGAFQIKLIIWSIFIAMIDGYDIGAIAFAAPSLIREWHVEPKALGLVLSASNIGVLFGSQIFGWIGDRYGRKTSLILCNLLFGVFTLIAALSPGSASAASSRISSPSTPNPRRAICAPLWRSSPPAWCRSAARSPALPARR
jgi:MFS family permease